MATAFSALRQSVGRLLGAGDIAMVTGTPSGGYGTNTFQCSTLDQYEDDFFNEWFLRIYAGTHKDTTCTVTDFAKTNGVLTFSPAVVANIDATDLFELHRDFTVPELNNAINQAISMVDTEALLDKVDQSLVIDDALTDGLFETWTSTSVLTNWTNGGTGTLARESTIKIEGTYSAKLTNTASNAFWIYQSVSNPRLFAGQTASLYARVNTATADRVRLRLYDGVNTWNSDYHDGKGWREAESDPWLSIEDVTLSTALTELTVSFRIETGTAIDAYVDKMYLVTGNKIYEYSIPSGFYTIETICPESGTVDRFHPADSFDGRGWRILGSSTKKIWFNKNWVTLKAGRRLRLEGQQKPGQLTLDADTTEISSVFLVQQAKGFLHQGRGEAAQARDAFAIAGMERRKLFVAARGKLV